MPPLQPQLTWPGFLVMSPLFWGLHSFHFHGVWTGHGALGVGQGRLVGHRVQMWDRAGVGKWRSRLSRQKKAGVGRQLGGGSMWILEITTGQAVRSGLCQGQTDTTFQG